MIQAHLFKSWVVIADRLITIATSILKGLLSNLYKYLEQGTFAL